MISAPWQRVDDAPNVNTGIPTVPLVVAVWDEIVGPLQPVAVAVMVEMPLQAAE